ncbi:hypothetical protein L210DRAFT_3511610 [Boletus edulis BED1]|uniref:Uncharacterized protein n=1 Tax=Boletus edulis BED1 TaxID=1328754 RepID=A0AAD4BBV1_BOLED|nr:hypothetical protein L210DRAFT_3511610 [Boletus edulis BED1]
MRINTYFSNSHPTASTTTLQQWVDPNCTQLRKRESLQRVAIEQNIRKRLNSTAREPVKLLGKPTGSATLSRRAGHPKKNDISTSTTRSATSEDSESAILRELKDLIGTSARQWIDGLCKAFISSKDCRDISRILSTFGALGERLRKLSFRQWTSAGNTTESTLSKSTSAIIKSLEDLCLKAMEDEDIKNLAERGLLLYQLDAFCDYECLKGVQSAVFQAVMGGILAEWREDAAEYMIDLVEWWGDYYLTLHSIRLIASWAKYPGEKRTWSGQQMDTDSTLYVGTMCLCRCLE